MTRASSKQPKGFRYALLIHNLRMLAPGGLVIVLALAYIFWGQVFMPWRENQDTQGSLSRFGVGTVTETMVPQYRFPWNAFVRLNGITYIERTDIPVYVGQKVWVTYRVGKSGRTYIQSIDELPAKD